MNENIVLEIELVSLEKVGEGVVHIMTETFLRALDIFRETGVGIFYRDSIR